MLGLACIKKDDIFYDLGCGYAQNLIVAATEYGVRNCVGIESKPMRYREALRRIEKKSLSNRITIVPENFDYVDLEAADVVFYGLMPDHELVHKFKDNLKKGCRLIYYFNALLPAIKPAGMDYPLYVSKAPVREAKTEHEWLSAIIGRNDLASNELWQEMYWRYRDNGRPVGFFGIDGNYLRSLKKFLRERLAENRSGN